MTIDPIKTGRFITQMRQARGLSVDQLAQYAAIPAQLLRQYEAGATVFRSDVLLRLSRALEVSVLQLMDGRYPPAPVHILRRPH